MKETWCQFKKLMNMAFQGKTLQIMGLYALIGLNALASFGLIWSTKYFVDTKTGDRMLSWGLGFAVVMLALLFGITITDFLIKHKSLTMGETIMVNLRTRMLESMLNTPYPFFLSHHTGQISSWLINDLDRIKLGVIRIVLNLGRDPILFIVLLSTILVLDFRLALIIMTGCGAIVPIIMKTAHYTRRLNRRMLDSIGSLGSFQRDSLAAVKLLKIYGAQQNIVRQYRHYNQDLKHKFIKTAMVSNLTSPIVTFGCGIAFLIAAAIGLAHVKSGIMTPGTLTAFVSSMLLFYRPVSSIAGFYNAIHAALGASQNVIRVLELEQENGSEEPQEIGYNQDVTLKNINFSYADQIHLLNNIKLKIRMGSSLAIVGPNGSGKSTLVAILLGLLKPHQGEVQLDGRNIEQLDLNEYRKLFGYVSADDPFFDDSIINNVTLFNSDYSIQTVNDVLASVGLADLVSARHQGLDTCIGESGIKLSKGQQQKLSLARALIRRPKILILDEATNSIDARAMAVLDKAAEKWLGKYTLILITHQMTLLDQFKQIVVLDKGRIVEQGTHEKLLTYQEGLYKELHDAFQKQYKQGRLV